MKKQITLKRKTKVPQNVYLELFYDRAVKESQTRQKKKGKIMGFHKCQCFKIALALAIVIVVSISDKISWKDVVLEISKDVAIGIFLSYEKNKKKSKFH